MADDDQRKQGDDDQMSAPAPAEVGPMPTIQPGIRIRWDLDQRIRAYIRKHGGTMREHYEAALEDYLKAREG